MEVLRVNYLTKKYGNLIALNNLDLSFHSGKIYGLLGPNGSGKTTLMNIISGLLNKTLGSVYVMGNDTKLGTKDLVSYMPSDDYLPKQLTIKAICNFYCTIYSDFNQDKAVKLLDFMELNESMTVMSLSTGMLGRLKLILTLSRETKLYLLDEPFKGIDLLSREKITKTIIENSSDHNCMIISDHLVSELESILDEIYFIHKGNMIYNNNTENIRSDEGLSVTDKYKEVFTNV